MDVIVELLREILERLIRIESFAQTSSHSRRCESLERYRVAYNRQNGFTDSTIHPANPDGEDEID